MTTLPTLHLEMLDSLHPIVKIKALELVRLAKDRSGLDLLVVSGYRSNEEQAALYAKGRDVNGVVVDPSQVVTNAKPGTSAHNFRLAFDVVPLRDGQSWWAAADPVWQSIYKLAEQVGLDALGDPWGAYLSWDKGHFQEPGSSLLMLHLTASMGTQYSLKTTTLGDDT